MPQLIMQKRRSSVREAPGADLLYDNHTFKLFGVSPVTLPNGGSRCGMSGLLQIGAETLKINFTYSDYSKEPSLDPKSCKPYLVEVVDGEDRLTLACRRIDVVLNDCAGTLSVEFDEQSFADARPSFLIFDGERQIGNRWQMQSPSTDEFLYAVQRHVTRTRTAA